MISRPSIALAVVACMTTALAPSGSAQGRDRHAVGSRAG